MTLALRVRGPGGYILVDSRRGPLHQTNQFLETLTIRGLSPATRRAYAFDVLALHRWLARRRGSVRALRAHDLLDFIAAQRVAGAQPASINRRLIACRLLYRFCVGHDLDGQPGALGPWPHYRGRGRDHALGLHPLRRSRRLKLRVKAPRRLVEPLTSQEVRAFLRRLRRYRDRAIVHLMLLCGLRSAEIIGLRCTDVGLEAGTLRVRGKGDKERAVPLAPVVAQSVRDYLHWERPPDTVAPALFVVLQGARRGRPMTSAGLRSLFRQRRRDYRLARANPHRFRHTFGADMARAGVRLPILQRLMGHADGLTTLQYIHLSMADVADEYARAVATLGPRYRR